MRSLLTAVPWGDLFRWGISAQFFVVVIGLPIAVATGLDEGASATEFRLGLLLLSAGIAAVVVWSDAVPWPGDD